LNVFKADVLFPTNIGFIDFNIHNVPPKERSQFLKFKSKKQFCLNLSKFLFFYLNNLHLNGYFF